MATGDGGRIVVLDSEGRSSRLLRVASEQASALAAGPEGVVYVGGTTDARVSRMGPGAREAGSYLSPPVDAGTVADWGRLVWTADTPRGTKVALQVRVGNTREPDDTWSDWVALDGSRRTEGVQTPVGPARWFQARADLSASRGASPLLSRLEVYYSPRNRPPAVTSVAVEPPGVVWVRTRTPTTNRTGPLVATDPVARNASTLIRGKARSGSIRKSYEQGARTLRWTAADPDQDRLRYRVELRKEGSADWLMLAADISESFYSWDARNMPDDLYRVRLTAEDSADNPAGKSFEHLLVSGVFRIDNTPPAVRSMEVQRGEEELEVKFLAADPGGRIAAVEVAVNGGDWEPLDPLDGVTDSAEERYSVRLEPAEAATPRSLQVRITDTSGNLGGDLLKID